MDKHQELQEIKKKISPVLKSHGVKKAGIFGSYARGSYGKKSDIDILVEIGNEMGLIEFIKLKLLIEKLLKKKVDLVEYSTVRPEIKENITKDEIPVL